MPPQTFSPPSPRDDVHELRLLFDLGQLLDSAVRREDMLDGTLRLLARRMRMRRGVITLVASHSERVSRGYGTGPGDGAPGSESEQALLERVLHTGKPMAATPKGPCMPGGGAKHPLTRQEVSFLGVPLLAQGQIVGALGVDGLFDPDESLEEDMRLLTIVAAMLARITGVQRGGAPINGAERSAAAGGASARPASFVGTSEAMRFVYDQIAQVAASTTTVLLRGESGTGKELAAQAIHNAGPRAGQPFVSLNCAALPENLIESELFGHEKGAFTGATGVRKGRFELAHGGTLFLDEVGELSLLTQARLLRVLQERRFERLGGMETRQVDVRIITATNRALEDMVSSGTFRRDLYYRLNVFPIVLPPLRERRSDILLLAGHFVERFAAANGRAGLSISLAAADMLQRYDWPGNIRELENAMERAVLLTGEGGQVLPPHLPPELHSASCPTCAAPMAQGAWAGPGGTLQQRVEELERGCIAEALARHEGHMGQAAQELGLTERIMALRMRKYGIRYQTYRRQPGKKST